MQSELTVDGLAQEIRRIDGNHSLGAGSLAEALIPFLSALSDKQAGEVKIKPLEWSKIIDRYKGSERREQWMAETPWGGFYIWHYQFDYDEVKRGPKFTVGSHQTPFVPTGTEYDTLGAAKAAAQSDYEQRIRSALVDVPAGEPVGYLKPDFPESVEPRYIPAGERLDGWAKSVFTIPVYTQPPLREGEDSAEVTAAIRSAGIKARDELLERMADGGSVDNDLADYMTRIIDACERAALAATRSASATTASGGQSDGN